MERETYKVVDMHTAGEPVRIVTGGYPPLEGATLLEKRRFVHERLDHVRTRLMHEPRGHAEMYGAILTEPSHPGCAAAVLFMHASGYSTMCGHATIALGRWLVDTGRVGRTGDETRFLLECPCGPVAVAVDTRGARTGAVSFDSVPAFACALDREAEVPGLGRVRFDIGYGGAFYAVLPAARLGLDLRATPLARLVEAATAITEAVRAGPPVRHPSEPDLSFLYGTILTDDEAPGPDRPSRNLCVFGDGQVDRSPTGSGVTARIAIETARGRLVPGTPWRIEGVTGVPFEGMAVAATTAGRYPAVTVRVSGRAYYCGWSEFVVEEEDPLRDGFLLPG
jgi:trans-L-3-hydroxyproline dehydratase